MRLFSILSVLLIAALATPAFAGLSHLRQNKRYHVTLEWSGSGSCAGGGGFYEVFADQTRSLEEYRVPRDRQLFITDVVFEASDGLFDLVVGRDLFFTISTHNETQILRHLILADPIPITTENQHKILRGAVHMTSAARVGGELKLCAFAASVSQGGSHGNGVVRAILEGYTIR